MAIVAMAIILSFHLKNEPSPLERHMALPLGIVFWALSLVCLCAGLANYLKTVQKYSRRTAVVQSGTKTQFVGFPPALLASFLPAGECAHTETC